jgi:hypothetical protein
MVLAFLYNDKLHQVKLADASVNFVFAGTSNFVGIGVALT